MVIAVVAIAYGTAAPGLAVAEFAPSAQKTLEAPTTTAPASTGAPGSGRRAGRTTTSSNATTTSLAVDGSQPGAALTTRVARTRSCVGNPPRQTDDPMSPACVATIFEGDNGGATSTGVSATEIRLAIPSSGITGARRATIDALVEHINQRFELYGRRVVPVYVQGSTITALESRAVAAEVAKQSVFAAVTGSAEWNTAAATLPFDLAREQVVSIGHGVNGLWSDRTLFDPSHPYVWSAYPSSEDVQANLADFACRALAGRAAAYAGDAGLRTQTRKFGIVAYGYGAAPVATLLARALEACTGVMPPMMSQQGNSTPDTAVRSDYERLKAAGVTTVICLCGDTSATAGNPDNVGWHPEWIFPPGYNASGNDEHWLQAPVAQGRIAPPIRLGSGPKLQPIQARPFFSAVQGLLGTKGADVLTILSMGEFVYPEMLILATGIQGAGPNLTPETFAQALMTAQFPNPGAGQAPFWQPTAGFGPGDHSLFDDYNVAWWSGSAEALDTGLSSSPKGSWCYLGQGARYAVGRYPADAIDLLFNPSVPCR